MMNTKKHKNKSRGNKPVNPVTVSKTEKPVESVEVTEDFVPEERVPEIINDLSLPENVEGIEPFDNSPQKPKRNRGKKKKDKEDLTENVKPPETKPDMSDLIIVTAEQIQLDLSENKDNSVISMETVSRKKKGKDKAKTHQEQGLKVLPKEETQLPQEQCKLPEDKTEKVSVSESEIKSSKKNKKKSKKRNDSERSDKTDDIMCTTAFQKILQSDKKEEELVKDKNERKDICDSSVSEPTVREADNKEKLSKIIPESNYKLKANEEILSIEPPKTEPTPNKKKNKKDKKHQVQEIGIKEITVSEPEINKENVVDKDIINIELQNVLEFQTIPTEDDTTLVTESVPKNKAKIAKPVERKNKTPAKDVKVEEKVIEGCDSIESKSPKDKAMISVSSENLLFLETDEQEHETKVVSTDSVSNNKNSKKGKKSPKLQDIEDANTAETTKCVPENEKSDLKPVEIKEITDIILQPEKEPVNIIPVEIQSFTKIKEETTISSTDNDLKCKSSKKNKKSPKKTQESPSEIEITLEKKLKDSNPIVVEEIRENPKLERLSPLKIEEIKDEITSVTEQIMLEPKEKSTFDQLPDITLPLKEHLPVIEEIPLVKPLEITDITDQFEEKDITMGEKTKERDNLELEFKEFEVVKKRKKSPKPPKNTKKPQDDLMKPLTINTEQPFSEVKVESQRPVEVFHEPSKKDTNIPGKSSEIPSVDNSNMNVDPPASAEITDSNNNAIIQETGITAIAIMPQKQNIIESILEPVVPKVIPLPYESLVIKQPGKPLAKEKTDLKSKVMEVNEDMEGLRLSIEKSLAEFAALEERDAEIEANVKAFDTLFDIPQAEVAPQSQEGFSTAINISLPITDSTKMEEKETVSVTPDSEPIAPSRKDNKKNKSKKNKSQSTPQSISQAQIATVTTETAPTEARKEDTKDKKQDQESKKDEKGKQQSDSTESSETKDKGQHDSAVDPIDKFEDALTSSIDDVNRTFEMIVKDVLEEEEKKENMTDQDIGEIEPDGTNSHDEKKTDEKQKPTVSQPKNLLGQPNIPARSNKIDYKKERNKTPNTKQAKVKIKDATDVEKAKISKQCQTENKPKIQNNKVVNESKCVTSENDEYIYKYSFRKVFLPSNCHVCKKDLNNMRVECNFCHLISYCGQKHRDEDFPQHQAFCFAVSTITHLKGQKHIYSNIQNLTGQNYRLLRMQTILSCEKMLKRKLVPCEQELLLYPRLCADEACREWRVGELRDCDGCGQISFCGSHRCPKSHSRWCKSYSLYRKLVVHQLTRGRLEPPLPARGLRTDRICDNINRVLADMYAEKIDMDDKEYASLTQLATAPMTAAYCLQVYCDRMKMYREVTRKPTLTVHIVGAELQFEADSLGRWERFLLHVQPPEVNDLRVVLVGPELNPSQLPLDLLGKVKMCADCRVDKRRVVFNFEDKKLYHDYCDGDDYVRPDLVCAFNPSICRVATYDDSWLMTLKKISKQRVPFVLTAYTMNELQRDLSYIKKTAEFNTVAEAMYNPFASVRPDRNFISDDEMPLLFKNYCLSVLIGPL